MFGKGEKIFDLEQMDEEISKKEENAIPLSLQRTSDFLTHPIFHRYHSYRCPSFSHHQMV